MNESLWAVAKALVPALIICVQIFFGVDLMKLNEEVGNQGGQVEELATGFRVQEVRLANTIEHQTEFRAEIRNTVEQHVQISNEFRTGGGEAAALAMARQAESLGESYRQLLLDREQRMDARETDMRRRTHEIRTNAAEAIAELQGLKATLEGAANDARFAAAHANASPRYVMVEGGTGPAAFWLPEGGAFKATLEDVVEDGRGNHVAHVVVQAGSREPLQLRLGEFSGYQALPETGWAVRPALVYDSLTIFGRRRLVILEMIPDHLADDPSAIPVQHEPAREPLLESAAG